MEFLLDRQARRRSPRTIEFYTQTIDQFHEFLLAQGVAAVPEISPAHMRRYLIELQREGRKDGGILTQFRGARAFLRWDMDEYLPKGWDPLRNVPKPGMPKNVLPPLSLDDFEKMMGTSVRGTFLGDRDRALLLLLLDTGMRWDEVANLTVGDVDMDTGSVWIRKGKGGKSRTVFVGFTTRRALLAYFRHRGRVEGKDPLWVIETGGRLSKSGIREVKRRAAEAAGIPEPGMHAFRRAFAINSLTAGMGVEHLRKLLGHADLFLINRYAKLTDPDLAEAHRRFGVVDRLDLP